jgi:VRR-NUC domain
MNATERMVKEMLEKRGFRVLRNGWPDFFALRKDVVGWDIMAVEVKNGKDTASDAQEKMHRALDAAHIPVFIARLNSDQVRLSRVSPWHDCRSKAKANRLRESLERDSKAAAS